MTEFMGKSKSSSKWPLAVSLFLHALLIGFFFFHLSTPNYRMPGPVMPVKVVQAVALDQNQVTQRAQQMLQQEKQKQDAETEQLQKIQDQANAARLQRIQEQQKLQAIQQQQRQMQKQIQQQKALAQKQLQEQIAAQKALAQKQLAQQLAQQKALALQKQQQALAQAKKLAAQNLKKATQLKLANQQKALQQKLLSQQLKQEQQELTAQTQNAQNQGVINQYLARIVQAIGQNWIVPDGVNRDLKSVFMIHLAPGGGVLTVQLMQSSGNDALDHSAQVAIYKASPLPVPNDPSLFDKFRELRLTVTPKEILNG